MLGRAASLVRKNRNQAVVFNFARESDNGVEPEPPDAKLFPQAPNSQPPLGKPIASAMLLLSPG
jgi:hypothetical protein